MKWVKKVKDHYIVKVAGKDIGIKDNEHFYIVISKDLDRWDACYDFSRVYSLDPSSFGGDQGLWKMVEEYIVSTIIPEIIEGNK